MCVFFFKQKTADELRISDWSSDVCSSDPALPVVERGRREETPGRVAGHGPRRVADEDVDLAALERRRTSIGTDRTELDRLGIAEHSGGDGAAEIDIEDRKSVE